ncbi:hypothetical protein EV702DRAFT_1203173 [Suillus placidus]|uniref:Uncharacterized protein n=1 Tax=Suillus placidus TaxID=48579 RepID=A0A9P7CYB3_9AGAM|nr:hypothetical protein EV702DRAFT_1203173 [Suillus placidus]
MSDLECFCTAIEAKLTNTVINQDTVAAARKASNNDSNLFKKVCEGTAIILLSPEQLESSGFQSVVDNKAFAELGSLVQVKYLDYTPTSVLEITHSSSDLCAAGLIIRKNDPGHVAHKDDKVTEWNNTSNSPPQRPMSSPEYNFNFNPPPPVYGHPSTPAGHAYSGMVGAHEMGRAMYQGGPTGMPDGRPMSVPALTPGLSSHELQRPASVVPIIDP